LRNRLYHAGDALPLDPAWPHPIASLHTM